MSSLNEIFVKLRLTRQDLNNLSTSQLRNIFLDLTVKEISLLCIVSKKFNAICEDESFWREKVLDNYGVENKYGSTWRITAKSMDEKNMINLNNRWIDGRTYKQILNEALQMEYIPEFFVDLQEKYLLPYVDNSEGYLWDLMYDENIDYDYFNLDIEADTEDRLQKIANKVLGRDYTEEELNDIFFIKSREMKVIYQTGVAYEIDHSIDPIILVMKYSYMSEDTLGPIHADDVFPL
uniref:F-box-like family protein n=1 Tax=Pithovirus LCPAC406 TaxID=2506599 RepID=A0A481ZDF8_9VIRU|nr:MAG: F-box-like family protein [Pithovirus LCPAC406]